MSRQLPARANLEHLRNEAKQRLKEMRAREAAARLADAQLAVAREYGFASWRQLKAAVDQRDRERVFAAARQGDLEEVRRALERGFHPGTTDAIALQRYDLAERMLADDPGRIGPDGRDTIALHVLVAKRNVAAVRWLIEHGVDVNAKRVLWDCNSTALHVTAEHGAVELAQMLLDAGADPGIHDDKYDATVLEWTEYCGQPRIAALLRGRGVTA